MDEVKPRPDNIRTGVDVSPQLQSFLEKTDGGAPKPGPLAKVIDALKGR